MTENRIRIGVIADDFTGAGDAASFLKAGGLRTQLRIWPCQAAPADLQAFDAVVIALKSRSDIREKAVSDNAAALQWLLANGAEKIYFKYCSTFDSTPDGNIGPVADQLMQKMQVPYTILCPSLLANGRKVKGGRLYVNDIPLDESHMKDHPLNPMWDSRISHLMSPQSSFPVFSLDSALYKTPEKIQAQLDVWHEMHEHFYIVPDYDRPEHGAFIAKYFMALPLWTGGSELLYHFAKLKSEKTGSHNAENVPEDDHYGRVMLAGSCSIMTRKQIARFRENGGRAFVIEPEMVFEDMQKYIDRYTCCYLDDPCRDILFYTSDRRGSRPGLAQALENFSAALIRHIVKRSPVRRVIIAGGETSGAVTTALGYNSFVIGDSVAPGVPILYPTANAGMALVLKSGNFGDEDFFLKTLNS